MIDGRCDFFLGLHLMIRSGYLRMLGHLQLCGNAAGCKYEEADNTLTAFSRIAHWAVTLVPNVIFATGCP
jgi:hypothetical protein